MRNLYKPSENRDASNLKIKLFRSYFSAAGSIREWEVLVNGSGLLQWYLQHKNNIWKIFDYDLPLLCF